MTDSNLDSAWSPSQSEEKLPPGPKLVAPWYGVRFIRSRPRVFSDCTRRYGDVFSLTVPVFGRVVVIADPQLGKALFTAPDGDTGRITPGLDRIFGPGSVFALDQTPHRNRRRLLAPPFHGRSIKNYERIFVEETLRETASWPSGKLFATLPSMMRITLDAILRAVFGAEDADLNHLRRILPSFVTLGSRLAVLSTPSRTFGRFTPWGRLAAYRRQYDAVINRLIDKATADADFDSRDDVLAILLKSRYEDGSTMSVQDIADELLGLLAAGHETSAATLSWAFERITRHPRVLDKLNSEAETPDNAYRHATITEVQRVRTVIDLAGRQVRAPSFHLGEWDIPKNTKILIAISQLHSRSQEFPDPQRFCPDRYLADSPPSFAWLPFGAGIRRCAGAAFAELEMDVVLRTVLRHFTIYSTTRSDEKVHPRGIANTPADGGLVMVRRRPVPPSDRATSPQPDR